MPLLNVLFVENMPGWFYSGGQSRIPLFYHMPTKNYYQLRVEQLERELDRITRERDGLPKDTDGSPVFPWT